jgi:quercetin dioxygenase-like cupin family protein
LRVIRAGDRLGGNWLAPKGRFMGSAMQTTFHETNEETRGSFVRFEAGAHTHWHAHSGGQVLHIVEGQARVQAWGMPPALHAGTPVELEVGDTAIAPPGEKHWHGASAAGPMTQLAITSGEVTWMEDSEPPD